MTPCELEVIAATTTAEYLSALVPTPLWPATIRERRPWVFDRHWRMAALDVLRHDRPQAVACLVESMAESLLRAIWEHRINGYGVPVNCLGKFSEHRSVVANAYANEDNNTFTLEIWGIR